MSFFLLNFDSANFTLGEITCLAEHRQQPTWFCIVLASNSQGKPNTAVKVFTPLTLFAWLAFAHRRVQQLFRCRPVFAEDPYKGSCHLFRAKRFKHLLREFGFVLLNRFSQCWIAQQTLIVALQNFFSRRGLAPNSINLSAAQQAFGAATCSVRHNQGTHPFASGTARPATSVKQGFAVFRNVGVNNQLKVRQVNPTSRNICGDTHPSTAIAHGL